LAAANSPASRRIGQPRTATAATAAASISSASGSRAVDHDAPDSVTTLGGPRPSNDRIATHGSRDAVHSAPAAATSSNWAIPTFSRLVCRPGGSGRVSATAARLRSGQRLGGGDRIQHGPRLIGSLRVFVGTVGVRHYPTTGLDVGSAVTQQRGADSDR